MAQQLKRWESPRRPGRNQKGRGGAARQRQLQKRRQTLRQRLKQGWSQAHPHSQGEGFGSPPETFKGDHWTRQVAIIWAAREHLRPLNLSLGPIGLP